MTAKAAARPRKTKTQPGENPLTFYPAWCKKCGICIAFCPKSVLEAGPGGQPFAARPEDCIRCHLCELRCPDFAVSVADEDQEESA
ncbi:MAG: 4Fe-4S dicluster domain-containing protein [Deferrisomatales bacterium]